MTIVFSRTTGLATAALLAFSIGCSGEAPETAPVSTIDDTIPEVGTRTQSLTLFCGGPSNRPCDPGTVCLPFAGGCPAPGSFGLCVPSPSHCYPTSNPVCGCDGTSYANFCEALKNGSAVEHSGECEVEEPECSADIACPGAGICVDEAGAVCGRAGNDDCVGTCLCKSTEKCDPREILDLDPAICGCRPMNACDTTKCDPRTVCVLADDGTATCVPGG